MSASEIESQDAWKDAFFDKHDRTTPARDHQTSWQLTAIGVTVGLLTLIMLSI